MTQPNDSQTPESWIKRTIAPRYPADDSEESREQRFWMGLLYAALAGYLAVTVTVLIYAGLTWTQPNRGWIALSMLSAIVFAGVCYLLRHHAVSTRYRVWIFAVWNTVSFCFVITICALDGGMGSPITVLLILPMFYLAIGYPLRAVLGCGVAGLTCTAMLVWLTPASTPELYTTLMLQFMVLNIGFLLAVIGATVRERKDQELHQLRQRLETLATTDSLTDCLNHRAFTAAMTREVARASRYQRALSLLVIDLDHFKHINDRHGHMMGDEVLRQVGAVLRNTARHADIVGRPGGDELTLLAPETDSEDACALAERLRDQMKAHSLLANITLSIGVCALTPDTQQAATLFRRADQALYMAKRRGRDQVAVYDEHETAEMAEDWAQVS